MKAEMPLQFRAPGWRAASVYRIIEETSRMRSLELLIPGWTGHRPGQHIEMRLPGNEMETRKYSIASAPEAPYVSITVERLADSRFSEFLTNDVRVGETFDLRGPFGEQFVWDAAMTGPLFLIAGGSGIAPLMAMLRHRKAAGNKCPALLVYSSASFEDIVYREELEQLVNGQNDLRVVHSLTRQQPVAWQGEKSRVDREMLSRIGFSPSERPRIYICGATKFADFVASALIEIGHSPGLIKQECYGPR